MTRPWTRPWTRPCQHRRQTVVVRPDGSRYQRCDFCRRERVLAPDVPRLLTDAELLSEAERRTAILLSGWPLVPHSIRVIS